jgi:Tubulin like
MATPTVIIGIGTSGLRILENVQRFYYESFGVNKPEYVQYMYIETDSNSEVGITPIENEIKQVILSLKEMKTMCKYVQNLGASWVPPLEELSLYTIGAGGVRPNGRVGLWGKNSEQKNYIKVKDAIENAVRLARSPHNPDITDTEPAIFVTGSLTGGTGSGIFIDLAYLIRKTVTNIGELYGLFLLPPNPTDLEEKAQYYANAYGAISDLNYYNRSDTHYKETLPDGEEIDSTDAPFGLTQLISQNYVKGDPAISTVDGLYKMAGLNLFLNIIGVKEHRMARLVDAPPSHYGTFGLSGIQFPKDQIQEYVAATLSINLVERWNDNNQYILQGNKENIPRNDIAEIVKLEWDSIMNDAFHILDSVGNITIKNEIKDITNKIMDREITDSSRYLFEKFTSRSTNNFYVALQDNISNAVNIIIDRIYKLNNDILNRSENLYYAKTTLEYVTKFINDTNKFWQTIGVSSFPKNWEISLEKMIADLNKNNYKYILEHQNVLSEKIYSIYEFMKMHFLASKLVDIQDNILNKEQSLISTSKIPLKLPKTYSYDKIATELSKVIKDKKSMSFSKRMEDIKQDINDNTLPILRVFQYGSFEAELEYALTEFNRNNSYPSKADLMQNESLWEYLSSIEISSLQSQVYKDCITKFRVLINNKKYVKDYDVTKYIRENLNNGIRIAKKATNVFLSIKEGHTLDKAHYLPRFVAASSRNSIEEVLRLFQNSEKPYSDFPLSEPKTILPLPNLQNIMVFYDEKTGLVPLEMISYADRMKKVYDTKPRNIVDISEEQWKIRTRAYVPEFKNEKTFS